MNSRYSISTTLRNTIGNRYYSTIIYPTIYPSLDDRYIITNTGDRLDILANEFYGDPMLWWIIAIANNNNIQKDSLYPTPGIQLRIPANVATIQAEYRKLNNNR